MYALNKDDGFDITLRFWLERFFYSKFMGLTPHRIKDKNQFAEIVQDIQSGGRQSIDDIALICKKARKIGLLGINTYANPLFVFYQYCIHAGFSDMRELQADNVQEFLNIYTANLSANTLRNYQFALINFFDFVQKNNIDENGTSYLFTMDIIAAKRSSKQELPEYLTQEEFNQFLEALRHYNVGQKRVNDVVRIRNQLIILMIAYSGARVSEILDLGFKDVSIDSNYYMLRLRGKGNKMRIVYISQDLIRHYYESWLELRNTFHGVTDEMPFFVNRKFHVPTQPYIYVIIETLLASIGIRKAKNGAHLLRHTFATMLYTKSKDLILVQESLGHSSIETSRIYTHFDNTKLKHAANVVSDIDKK